jgi:ABC-type sugar transport system permease subunit
MILSRQPPSQRPNIFGLANFVLKSLGLPQGLWVSSAGSVIPSLVLVDIASGHAW